jgi:hypothetical protein
MMVPGGGSVLYSRTEIEAIVRGCLPEGFIDATMRALVDANREAKKAIGGYAKPEHRDLFGHLQRASFEGKWREGIAPFDGVRIRTRLNKKRTSRYTIMHMDRLVLTASAVKEPSVLPRYANFRNTLALASQGELFVATGTQSAGGLVYGIVTHSTNSEFDLYDAALVLPGHSGMSALLRLSLLDQLQAALEMNSGDAPEEKIPEPQLPGVAAKIAARKKTGA